MGPALSWRDLDGRGREARAPEVQVGSGGASHTGPSLSKGLPDCPHSRRPEPGACLPSRSLQDRTVLSHLAALLGSARSRGGVAFCLLRRPGPTEGSLVSPFRVCSYRKRSARPAAGSGDTNAVQGPASQVSDMAHPHTSRRCPQDCSAEGGAAALPSSPGTAGCPPGCPHRGLLTAPSSLLSPRPGPRDPPLFCCLLLSHCVTSCLLRAASTSPRTP